MTVPAKSTTICWPSWRTLTGVRGSVSCTITRPVPSEPRRKSMVRMLRARVAAAAPAPAPRARGRVRLADVGAGLLAQGDDDVVAIHLRGVRQQGVDIDDQARAAIGFGGQHRVDAAGAHVDAARGQRQRGVGQVERDARRLVDGEGQRLGRRAAHVQLELHLLTRQGLNVDGLRA